MWRRWLWWAPLVLWGCGDSEKTVWQLTGDQASDVSLDDLAREHQPLQTVATNRGEAIPAGFHGTVHPLIAHVEEIAVSASWTPLGTGRAASLGYFPLDFYEPFQNLTPVSTKRNYHASDFSGFLPEEVGEIGQVWSLDERAVTRLLRQLHPSGSMRLKAPGRRAGPNGGFAILRAKSPTHLDIVFRIHGEFQPTRNTYITPSHFGGRLIVNQHLGTIEYFQMAVPREQLLNVTLTHVLEAEALIDLVTVDRMELTAGTSYATENLPWTESLEVASAEKQLKEIFYKFLQVDWVEPAEAVAKAKERNKPIMAVILWGSLDEQSC